MTTFKIRLLPKIWLIFLPGLLVNPVLANYDATHDIRFRELPGVDPLRQSLDVFIPLTEEEEEAPSNLPVLLYVHGGRWTAGDKNLEDSPLLDFFIAQGFVVVSTNYRLSDDGRDQHPAQIEDVADAVGWISDNIRYRSGNPRAIYLIGHGAGAHLVALLATDHSRLMDVGVRPVDIKGVVLLDPVALDLVDIMSSDDRRKNYHQSVFGDDSDDWRDASPYHHIRPEFPPAPHLIVAACPVGWPAPDSLNELKDRHWSTIERYAAKLRESEVRVDMVNAMQFQSFRSVDRDLGAPEDQTTQLISRFFDELETSRTERVEVPTKGMVHTITVEGDAAKRAAQELGDMTFDLWNYDKSRNIDTPIAGSEFPSELRKEFISWDTNNNEFLERKELHAAFEALMSE